MPYRRFSEHYKNGAIVYLSLFPIHGTVILRKSKRNHATTRKPQKMADTFEVSAIFRFLCDLVYLMVLLLLSTRVLYRNSTSCPWKSMKFSSTSRLI